MIKFLGGGRQVWNSFFLLTGAVLFHEEIIQKGRVDRLQLREIAQTISKNNMYSFRAFWSSGG